MITRILLILTVIFGSINISAQTNKPAKSKSRSEWFNEMSRYKAQFIASELKLSEEQKQKFVAEQNRCTDEALCAVRDYMVQELLGGIDCHKATSSGYEWTLKNGRTVELRVTIKESSP